MFKKIIGLFGKLLPLIITTSLWSQSWVPLQNPTGQTLRSISMQTSTDGWICGDAGTVLHTADGWNTWSSQFLGGNDLGDLAFFDSATGVVVGDGGRIFYTHDGGNQWTETSASGFSRKLQAVAWGSNQVVWAAGRDGAVLKSADSGVSWSLQNTGIQERLYSVAAIGSDSVWAVGDDGMIIHSSDGGATWVTQASGINGQLNSIHFVSSSLGYLCGESQVKYTSNGGQTWVFRSTGILEPLNSVFFLDEISGWAVGEAGTIYHTTNGGQFWAQQLSSVADELHDVCFVSPNVGWAIGDFGRLLFYDTSTPIVQKWIPGTSQISSPLSGTYMINDQEIWACGEGGMLLHSLNAGSNWSVTNINGKDLNDVVFRDIQTAIVVGDTTIRTTDGGVSWDAVAGLDTVEQLRGVAWGDGDIVWAAGNNGVITRSTDAGQNWTVLNSGVSVRFRAIAASGSDLAWVAGEEGVVLHTSDAGNSWSLQNTNTLKKFDDIQFLSATTGYACGSGSNVIYTSDGGQTWVQRDNGILTGLNGIHFLNEQKGWAVGSFGTIFATTDGGLNWIQEYGGVSQDLNDVNFSSEGHGLIVGNSGIVLRYDPLATAIANEPEQSMVKEFELLQNYPNPFNPTTTIPLSIHNNSRVKLSIYNISGQQVKVLYEGTLQYGQHEFHWNGDDQNNNLVSSGIYFYTLTMDSRESVSKKLILIR